MTGWFSVDGGEATAGDLIAMELVTEDLESAGCSVDVATNAGFADGVDLSEVDPGNYDILVVVCGPLHGDRLHAIVDRFPHARKVAVNVSVVEPSLAERFHAVIARTAAARPGPT